MGNSCCLKKSPIFQGKNQDAIDKLTLEENMWNNLPPEKLALEENMSSNLSLEKLTLEENMWNNLPPECWMLIFKQFSSLKDIQNCYFTCQTWQSIIKEHYISKY